MGMLSLHVLAREIVKGTRPELLSNDPRVAALVRSMWHHKAASRPHAAQVATQFADLAKASLSDGAAASASVAPMPVVPSPPAVDGPSVPGPSDARGAAPATREARGGLPSRPPPKPRKEPKQKGLALQADLRGQLAQQQSRSRGGRWREKSKREKSAVLDPAPAALAGISEE